MGIIQSAVNQMLGTAGIMARLNPGLERRQQLSNLKKQEKAIKSQQDILGPRLNVSDYLKEEPSEATSQQFKESEVKLSDIKQKQFELKPTKESANELIMQRSRAGKGSFMTLPADPDDPEFLEARYQQAMSSVANKQDAQQKQKRNFMSYLKEQPTSFGGTVGDLPINMQKAAAKQYSPAERKKLMNTMDKEKMDNGK